jgi:hypothetical protein
MGHKSTDAEIDRRIEDILELMFRRATKSEIVRYASDKWGITSRQTEDYIKWAKNRLRGLADIDLKEALGEAINDITYLLREAKRTNDLQLYKGARKLLSEHQGIIIDRKHIETTLTGDLLSMIEEGEKVLKHRKKSASRDT